MSIVDNDDNFSYLIKKHYFLETVNFLKDKSCHSHICMCLFLLDGYLCLIFFIDGRLIVLPLREQYWRIITCLNFSPHPQHAPPQIGEILITVVSLNSTDLLGSDFSSISFTRTCLLKTIFVVIYYHCQWYWLLQTTRKACIFPASLFVTVVALEVHLPKGKE